MYSLIYKKKILPKVLTNLVQVIYLPARSPLILNKGFNKALDNFFCYVDSL